MDGLLVIDKPAGPTSHDVVARVRRALREPRVGHTGTLDPAATGVLPLVLGRATRLAQFLSGSDKSYDAVVRLGFSTDTADAQGRALGAAMAALLPGRDAIEQALEGFRGTFLQQPPAFSAKKIDGTRSHTLARAHRRTLTEDRDRSLPDTSPSLPAPVRVTVRAIRVVSVDADCVTLTVDCSAGFYVRALAHDLGERLGVGGHLVALRRTRCGDFGTEDAVALDVVDRQPREAATRVIPLARMLPGLAPVVLTPDGVRKAIHGRELEPRDYVPGPESRIVTSDGRLYRLLDQAGSLVAIARPSSRPLALHPSVVLM